MNNNQGNNKTNRTNGAYWASLGPRPFLSLMINVRGLLGFIGLIAMALMSCSSSEDGSEPIVPPQETGTPIAFSANQGEESSVTRGNRRAGTPLSETGVHAFNVWGYKSMTYSNGEYSNNQTVFPGYIVNWAANSAATTTTNSNGWEYISSDPEQTIKYWDWSAKAYRFYAVTAGTPNETITGQVSFTMTANASPVREGEGTKAEKIAANIADTPYFSKLWFSTGDPVAYPDKQFGKPVQLEFIKPFARVRFLFTYSYEAEGIKLKDPVFKPTDDSEIKLKGTFTVTYPLVGTATSESYTITDIDHSVGLDKFDKEYIPEGGAEREVWYTVLPIDPSTTQGSYTLTVSVNGGSKSCVVPAQYMQWKPGFSYTYIFKITDSGGVEIDMVQAAFTPWTENESDEYEVYNW